MDLFLKHRKDRKEENSPIVETGPYHFLPWYRHWDPRGYPKIEGKRYEALHWLSTERKSAAVEFWFRRGLKTLAATPVSSMEDLAMRVSSVIQGLEGCLGVGLGDWEKSRYSPDVRAGGVFQVEKSNADVLRAICLSFSFGPYTPEQKEGIWHQRELSYWVRGKEQETVPGWPLRLNIPPITTDRNPLDVEGRAAIFAVLGLLMVNHVAAILRSPELGMSVQGFLLQKQGEVQSAIGLPPPPPASSEGGRSVSPPPPYCNGPPPPYHA